MTLTYFFANATLVLRLLDWLQTKVGLRDSHVIVVHRLEGWIIRLCPSVPLAAAPLADTKAFMGELGNPYQPAQLIQQVFDQLDAGQSPVAVMRQYQVVVVSHGRPNPQDISAFRNRFIHGLGYCPAHLA